MAILGLVLLSKNYLQSEEIIFFKDYIYLPEKSYISTPLNDEWTSFDSLDEDELKILLEIEDKNFYFHKGFSPTDIQSALFSHYVLKKKLRGASTITQQIARTLFLNREKTLNRKIDEIKLASILERNLSKNDILELYLNQVYWGHNLIGIQQASNYFFGYNPENLNDLQLKLLFNILKAPDRYTKESIQNLYFAKKKE